MATHAKAAYIDHAYSDSRFTSKVDAASGYKTNNIICVPIFNNEERCVAVLQVINKIEVDARTGVVMPADFTTQDKVLTHLLGRHMGVVIQEMMREAQLERGLAKLTELCEVSRRLCAVTAGTTRNFDVIRLAQRAEETCKEVCDTMYARVLFLEHKHADQVVKMRKFGDEPDEPDSDSRKLWYVVDELSEINFKHEPKRVWASTTSGISGWVCTNGKSIDVERPDLDDRFHSVSDLETHGLGLLSVPLLSPITQTPIGVLQCANRKRTEIVSGAARAAKIQEAKSGSQAGQNGHLQKHTVANPVHQRTDRENNELREFQETVQWYASQLAMTFELFQLVNVERNQVSVPALIPLCPCSRKDISASHMFCLFSIFGCPAPSSLCVYIFLLPPNMTEPREESHIGCCCHRPPRGRKASG